MEYGPTTQNLALRPADPIAAQACPGNLEAIIGRIEQAVEDETSAIRTDVNFDIKASNERKSRHLYELARAMKSIGEAGLPAEHRTGLQRLREKLAANEAAIRAHLNAVGEIAALMQSAIQNAETDGTYSAGQFGWAR